MDGVLVVDKPQGLTSHDVVAVCGVRCASGASVIRERLIHWPPACRRFVRAGDATRPVPRLGRTRMHDATVRFGLATDSHDITGAETARPDRVPTAAAVEAALTGLRGEHKQVPPVFSAKKVGGESLRKGAADEDVVLTPVPVR